MSLRLVCLTTSKHPRFNSHRQMDLPTFRGHYYENDSST
ncbi:hypothetical protein F0250_03150 [Vibrio cyclitrophicus]|nr:hypothetical protein [Vibrio cyclitrophicus]MCC4840662.1 hypothetical protein [Vibrio cyclitrophicus]NOH18463.1 hypothetical protein [Vibrio cyclitrophicus]NOI32978.1 hypothetical protein [Vibrio cyclitrophicus]